MKEKTGKKILKEAGVLLIAIVMVLSTAAVSANINDESPEFMLAGADDVSSPQQTNAFDIHFDNGVNYDAERDDIAISSTSDASDLGVLGDTFYAYNAYDPSGVLSEGPVSFLSDNPGTITLLKKTTSPNFIAGATWAVDTWYGCQFNNGWLWTIDEVTGTMTLIGGGGVGLNGLAYDPTTGIMYGASGDFLYTINMNTGGQTLVGPFNIIGLMVGLAFDGEGILYGENLNDNLYSINTVTGVAALIGPFGIDINYAQDMAYDITWNVLYLSAYTIAPITEGALYTCNVDTGEATKVGTFQGSAEITGFAILYIITLPPNTPEQPDGPDEGRIGVEYAFSTSTTDPDGDQVYYWWDWGDGASSGWLGPFNSGDTTVARHAWTEIGTYEIKVKAKDIYNRESGWSEPKTIHFVESSSPVLEIGNISGGLFRVSAVIKNAGGADAIGVNWSITLTGGFILSGRETQGGGMIPAGKESTVGSSLILGFGKTVITVSAEISESSDTAEQEAFVLLFFIKI